MSEIRVFKRNVSTGNPIKRALWMAGYLIFGLWCFMILLWLLTKIFLRIVVPVIYFSS